MSLKLRFLTVHSPLPIVVQPSESACTPCSQFLDVYTATDQDAGNLAALLASVQSTYLVLDFPK